MEEAEMLCDRLGIFVDGQVRRPPGRGWCCRCAPPAAPPRAAPATSGHPALAKGCGSGSAGWLAGWCTSSGGGGSSLGQPMLGTQGTQP
jgi:hypothetical protein